MTVWVILGEVSGYPQTYSGRYPGTAIHTPVGNWVFPEYISYITGYVPGYPQTYSDR